MSFFKHIGTKASKFQFHIWIDNVIGVYPSTYSTDEHSTEGIYVMLKRRNKSFRTKIALPENGGHVHMNDCIKFTSTLYQKKKRNDDVHIILPKPFILRVCNASYDKIRWETSIDLSDYASIFGVDSNESLLLQFSYKSNKSPEKKMGNNAMQNIPFEITVRIRIKSIWLKNMDNTSQTSTDSISRISSSIMSDLSDLENYKLYENIPKQIESAYNDEHQHKYHNVLFTALPEEHSINNSPIKPSSIPSPQHLIKSKLDKKRSSALESFKNIPSELQNKKIINLSSSSKSSDRSSSELPLKIRINSDSFESINNESTRIPNLSFLMSPDNKTNIKSPENVLSSPPTTISLSKYDVTNNSGFLLENELIRIDQEMNKLSMHTTHDNIKSDDENIINHHNLIHFILDICIKNINILSIEERLWNNLIPRHCAVIFRCFIRWNVFKQNQNNTQIMLNEYINAISIMIQNHSKNDLEQSYWLLRLTTIIYWIHLYFPHKFILNTIHSETPPFKRHETFEPILDDDEDDDEDELIKTEELNINNNNNNSYDDIISNDDYVEHEVQSENQTEDRIIPIERVDISTSDEKEIKINRDSSEEIEDEEKEIEKMDENENENEDTSNESSEESLNLQYWFVEKLTSLTNNCFNNIIDNTLQKLSRIPFQHVFDENEFGETGSNTMDMMFAVMNSVWFLWEDMKLYNIYRIQICQQVLQYTIIRLINNLLTYPEYCTIAGGFRLKVIKSMIADWCQSNSINHQIFHHISLLLDQVSCLLLTCAVVKNGKELLKMCTTLSAAQINQILNNYNAEATNEPLSAEILTPILEIAASELPPNKTRVSVQDICFCKQAMKQFNINDCPLPKIALCDIPIPFEISQHPQFKFLMDTHDSDNIVL